MDSNPLDIVFTGFGVVNHLGHDVEDVATQLREGRGKPFARWQPAVEYDGRCQLLGLVEADLGNKALNISASQGRFLGRSGRLALLAARQAVAQSGCDPTELAVLAGSGVGDCDMFDEIATKLSKTHSMRKVTPAAVPKLMASTVSANLATVFGARGPSCSVTAACAGGAYNITLGALLLQAGAAKAALVGGAEATHLSFYSGFDSMRAYNGDDNERPERASRPYAKDRAGFIFAEGAGMAVIETRASAHSRGARILGELRGFGMSSDGTGDMVAPSAEGGLRAMQAALRHSQVAPVDIGYVNTHGTSTPLGDISEVRAMRSALEGRHVPYSSIKGYTGHSVSAAGAIEAIFTLKMLNEGWVAPCINIDELDPELTDYPPVISPGPLAAEVAMSNSFGFGGTNITLVLGKA